MNDKPITCSTKQVAMSTETNLANTLCSNDNKETQAVATNAAVRRLTTVECARLQAFPEHHTEIEWNGKSVNECPQGHQYKAYGNSMCVNVIEWLGKQIELNIKEIQ